MTNIAIDGHVRSILRNYSKALAHEERLDLFIQIGGQTGVAFDEMAEDDPASQTRVAGHIGWLMQADLIQEGRAVARESGRVRMFKVSKNGRKLLNLAKSGGEAGG